MTDATEILDEEKTELLESDKTKKVSLLSNKIYECCERKYVVNENSPNVTLTIKKYKNLIICIIIMCIIDEKNKTCCIHFFYALSKYPLTKIEKRNKSYFISQIIGWESCCLCWWLSDMRRAFLNIKQYRKTMSCVLVYDI